MIIWLYLAIAIVGEVLATASLKASEGFTRTGPLLVVVLGYGAALFFLSLTLDSIPVGVAYAVWAGVGVALTAIVGWWWFGQTLGPGALAGMALIVAGVVVLNISSPPVR